MSGGDHPTTAPPPDDRDDDLEAVGDVDPWTTRCEVLAVLALIGVAGGIAQNVLNGLLIAGLDERTGFSWSAFATSFAAITFGPGLALLLVVALALVVLSPGSSIGGLGSGALQGIAVLGVVVATAALVGVVEVLRLDGNQNDQLLFTITGSEWLQRTGAIATFVPTGGLAAGAALFAWRTLAEVAPVSR